MLSDEIETLGSAFQNSGIELIVLPGTLKLVSPKTFSGCDSLRAVWAEIGCADVRQLVSSTVDVQQK